MKLSVIVNKLFLVLSILYLSGCGDSEDDSNPTGTNNNGNNIIEITQDIEEPTTWEGDNIYVIKKWDFYVMNTLTIEEGTIIKFTDDGPSLTLGESGTIIADGSSSEHIVFTSYKDDAHGGDTNGDDKSSLPAKSDWGNINTNSYNGSLFNYCDFYYGGDGSNSSTLYLFDSEATITNCTFAHNNGGTINFQDECVLEGSYAATGTIIKNNIFYDNLRPLAISPDINIDNSNIFHDPNNLQTTNTYNGIYVYAVNHITSHISWGETEVAFIIDGQDFYVTSGASLTLSDNVVIKFTSNSTINLSDGASAIINHNGNGVYFTSYKDDNYKGDTNGDSNKSSPADNDWLGIYDDTGATPYPYYCTWNNILYDSY